MDLSPQHERINELCSQVVATKDPLEFSRLVSELRNALRSQVTYLRDMVDEAKQTIAQLPTPRLIERRKIERRTVERRQSKHKLASVTAD
jgi:hypothetical protein